MLQPRTAVTSLWVTLSLATAVPTQPAISELASERPVLILEGTAAAGTTLHLALEGLGESDPSDAVLLAARPGSSWARVVARAAPDGRFALELPRGSEGLELALLAAGATAGERWFTPVRTLTVEDVDLAGFDPSVDRFAITGCSLGCSGVAANIGCSLNVTFENAELRLDTSQPVELSSVQQNPTCVSILDVSTASSPPGSFLLDPGDPSVLIFRPQLSFDPLGNASFGFEEGSTYQILVAGQAGGSAPPYLLSVIGAPMATRMACQFTTQGVLDFVPGPPSVTLTPAGGATGVPLDATIVLVFDDIMNLNTLVIPATGLAPFITIQDGSGAPVAGSFKFSVDQNANTTRVEFLPAQPLPPSETITVGLPAAITDLVGNPLANAGNYAFTTVP